MKTTRTPLSRLLALSLSAFSLFSALSLHADTLYWNGGNGTWMSGTGDALWSDSAIGGAGALGWTDGDNAVITSATPTLGIGAANNDNVTINDLTIANGLTLNRGITGTDQKTNLYLTGAVNVTNGSLNLTSSQTQLRLWFQSTTTGLNGTLALNGSAYNTVYAYFNTAASTSTATRIVNNLGTVLFGPSSGSNSLSFTIGELSGNNANAVISSAGSTNQTLRIDQNTDTTYAGKIGGTSGYSLNIQKAGTGTLSIGNDVSLGGNVTIEAGALYFNGATSARNTISGVTVQSGATLGGKGLVGLGGNTSRNITVKTGGILAPGSMDEIGTLTIKGNTGTTGSAVTSEALIFEGAATIKVRFGEDGSGNLINDQIVITGGNATSTTFGKGKASGGAGSILFDLSILGDGVSLVPGTYDLITFANTPGIAATAFGLTQASIDAGFVADGFAYDAATGKTLQITLSAVPVPEPTTLAAVAGALSLAAATFFRRRV